MTFEKWEEYRTVLWKKLDGKMQKVLRKASFEPSKEELAYLKEGLDKTWESIEAAILVAARKTVPYTKICKLGETKQHKTATIKAAIALGKLIREVKVSRAELGCSPLRVGTVELGVLTILQKYESTMWLTLERS
ncbi:18351_t:CDS:1 [Gigaspora rosea]|nr:18351_t:CDS:1 [Gigaspora rosea]